METVTDSYFRALCENVGFVLVATDCELKVRFWNAQAAEQFGRSADDMIGRSFLEVLDDRQRAEVEETLGATMATKSSLEAQVKFDGDDGSRLTFILIASPILDQDGSCIGVSASMRDISQRKRLSQELARSRRMASLGTMAGAVTHHFNNILGGMLTSIDYVLSSDSPRELRRTLRRLAQAIGRATRITSQLAVFAESGHQQTEHANLNPLLESFVERIRPRVAEANLTLVTEIEEVASRPFEAQRLMPVFESLGHNACDAMAAGGRLTVKMKQDGDVAVITVEDTGCGIPEDLLDRVFEPFFTTKGELAGGGSTDNIGLGLAAVHGLVSEMGGTIELASKVGLGTRVTVRLPLNRPTAEVGSSDNGEA
ncbi:MAG: ATP-binding protein [Planctomycetota bacterium]